MNCHDSQRQFDAMLSGQIGSAERTAVEAHLQDCAACAHAFAEARQLWELLGNAPLHPPSHGFADRVLRQLDARAAPAARWWMVWSSPVRWATVAALVIIAVTAASVGIYKHKQAEAVNKFAELFEVVQNVDPDTLLNATLTDTGDSM